MTVGSVYACCALRRRSCRRITLTSRESSAMGLPASRAVRRSSTDAEPYLAEARPSPSCRARWVARARMHGVMGVVGYRYQRLQHYRAKASFEFIVSGSLGPVTRLCFAFRLLLPSFASCRCYEMLSFCEHQANFDIIVSAERTRTLLSVTFRNGPEVIVMRINHSGSLFAWRHKNKGPRFVSRLHRRFAPGGEIERSPRHLDVWPN
jgi:hypothetical protein